MDQVSLNSSLHSWISFDETPWNNVSFPPCQYVNWTNPNPDEPTYGLTLPIITNTSCTQVCNDSRSLFGRQDNLATCGLWSTLVYAYNFNGSAPDPNRYIEKAPVDLLSSFAIVGLDAYDPEYFQSAVSYADVMSACFVYLYQNVKAWKSADDGSVSLACTKNGLFPFPSESNISVDVSIYESTWAVHGCLVDICSPVALNPELARVGFLVSFILQSSIAIVAFTLLLGLKILHWSNKVTLAALVRFHKAQCYFSSIVQVTALILFQGALQDTSFVLELDDFTGVHKGFVNTSALVVLATSGFIPVTFGLASITRFGRASWHLTMLSLITFVLATATLSTFYHYNRQYGKLDDYYNALQNDVYRDYGTCAIGGHVGDTLFPLCGSSLLNNNAISSSTITKWWVCVAWANCMVWMLLCLISKLVDVLPPKTVRSRLDSFLTRHPWMKMLLCFYCKMPPETVRSKPDSALTRHPWIKLLKKNLGRLNGRMLIFIVTATFCFGVQFYLINVFNRHKLVSQDWSFGQIIAVTVWVPSIFECSMPAFFELYRDAINSQKHHLEPKYPSPLGAMRDIIQQTVTMANYRPIKRSNDAALSDSDIEAVPLQSLSPAVDGHGTGQEDQQ